MFGGRQVVCGAPAAGPERAVGGRAEWYDALVSARQGAGVTTGLAHLSPQLLVPDLEGERFGVEGRWTGGEVAQVRIVDARVEHAEDPPLAEIERAVSLIPPKLFAGIRELRLLEEDPLRGFKHKPPRAGACYVPIKSSRRADIELYFWVMELLPPERRANPMFVIFHVTKIIGHELYHHRVRGQRVERRPKKNAEERRADRFGFRIANWLAHKMYPREEHEELWEPFDKKPARSSD